MNDEIDSDINDVLNKISLVCNKNSAESKKSPLGNWNEVEIDEVHLGVIV